MPITPPPSTALLTLWQDDAGAWHASVVTPDGRRLEFDSPFELARWSRSVVLRPAPADPPARGLR